MASNYTQTKNHKSQKHSDNINYNQKLFKIQENLPFDQKAARAKAHSIKINRNRLPADFFPKTESVRKRNSLTKPTLDIGQDYPVRSFRKAQSQKNNISPQKTSFFCFFEQSSKKRTQQSPMSIKRNLESRNEPMRQKILLEKRNLTAKSGIHRINILEMFPDNHDETISQTLSSSKKMKEFQISPRKESARSKYSIQTQDPEKEHSQLASMSKNLNVDSDKNSDFHNITFFNAKSLAFPSIHKNKSII